MSETKTSTDHAHEAAKRAIAKSGRSVASGNRAVVVENSADHVKATARSDGGAAEIRQGGEVNVASKGAAVVTTNRIGKAVAKAGSSVISQGGSLSL